MFSMGLDFNLRKLRNVGVTAIVTALIDVTARAPGNLQESDLMITRKTLVLTMMPANSIKQSMRVNGG